MLKLRKVNMPFTLNFPLEGLHALHGGPTDNREAGQHFISSYDYLAGPRLSMTASKPKSSRQRLIRGSLISISAWWMSWRIGRLQQWFMPIPTHHRAISTSSNCDAIKTVDLISGRKACLSQWNRRLPCECVQMPRSSYMLKRSHLQHFVQQLFPITQHKWWTLPFHLLASW